MRKATTNLLARPAAAIRARDPGFEERKPLANRAEVEIGVEDADDGHHRCLGARVLAAVDLGSNGDGDVAKLDESLRHRLKPLSHSPGPPYACHSTTHPFGLPPVSSGPPRAAAAARFGHADAAEGLLGEVECQPLQAHRNG